MPQCIAKANSTGKQCARSAIAGATVCRVHGGAAPQVKAKAAERLAALADPAITRLAKLIQHENGMVGLGAVRDALDRAGFKAPDKHEVSGPDGGPLTVELVVRFPEGKS